MRSTKGDERSPDSPWTVLLLATRLERGLSQRELAARAGTSGATVAAYESGAKEPRLSTLRRLMEAAGMRLVMSYLPNSADRLGPDLTREERRSLALHRAIAARLADDPDAVLAKARRNLEVMRRANDDGSAEPWFAEWERRLGGSRADLVEGLVSPAPHARDLRQVTPFAGVLSDEERQVIYARTRAA